MGEEQKTEEQKTEEQKTEEQKTEEPDMGASVARVMTATDDILTTLKSSKLALPEKIFAIALVSSILQTDMTMRAMNNFARDIFKDANLEELIKDAKVIAVRSSQMGRPATGSRQRDPTQS